MKNFLTFLIATVLVVAAVFVVYFSFRENEDSILSFEECLTAGYPVGESYPRRCTTPNGRAFTENIGNELNTQALIRVSLPRPNDVIVSPLIIEGEARGQWFFEASFPVDLISDSGTILKTVVAQAEGEWMTTNFVPFKAQLEFDAGSSVSGELIFHRDNPSGLPELDDEFRVPVKFVTAGRDNPDNRELSIYLGKFNVSGDDCNAVFPVKRMVSSTPALARAALVELFKGPTVTEKYEYFTGINPGVKIQNLTIDNAGIARVDLSPELEQSVGGSCRVAGIRAQIMATLKQFSTVREVVISINGRTEDILQP